MTTLRWGILSTAGIATEKAIPGMLRAARCEVVAIGSRDPARAAAVAERHGIARVHGSYEALVADPDVDAVYVPLPNHLHAEWTIAAARAGKHVLCEKPLALTPADAERMIEVCRAEGVALMEAFMYRLHPSWVAVRELVASGRIGRLAAVTSWFSYFNDDPANIRNVRAFGGGALFDIGCYSVNLSRMLFGSEPERVEAAVVRDPASGVDVLTSVLLQFPDGVATFTCSTRAEPDQQVHVYGTAGLDYKMPGMDGLSLLAKLRQRACRARCILISAYLNDDVRLKAKVLGVDRVLEKPVDVVLLRTVLADLLPASDGTTPEAVS